ncbi:MAG: S-layer homology domain-containing protein [Ruminococcaceae bacterium]|nr:S-layer homology domain-containing protein [Oscillospiraceae bacterium]
MTNIIKRFFAMALATVCLTATVFAQISMDENGVVTVKGELGQEYAGKMLSLDVYRGTDENGEKLSSLSQGEYLSYIVCHTQLMTDENGEYEYSFKISGNSGYLTAQIATEGDFEPIRESGFYYVSMEEYEVAVEVFNNADTADKMLDCLREYGMCLGLSSDEYENLSNKKDCAEILSSMRMLCGVDKAKRTQLYNTAIYIQRLNESKIKNVFEDNEYSGFSETAVKDLFEAEFITESFEKDMTARLSGKGFKTYEAYQNAVEKAFVFATVKNPNGYDNIKTVLLALSDETGISKGLVTTANCKKVAGMDFDSVSSLEAALKKEKESSSGGGGGGGGGGSSSKGDNNVVITVDAEIAQQEPVEEMNRDLFNDLEDVAWAKDAIVALAEKGIVNGKENEKFFPNDKITREEFVKIIVLAFDFEKVNSDLKFSDVDFSMWYAPYIGIAAGNGIVNGIDGNNFGTGKNITREDIATIIYRIAEKKGLFGASGEYEPFTDDANISSYAKEAVYALKKNEIISGNGSGDFMPKAYASRAEAVKIVYGLISIQ